MGNIGNAYGEQGKKEKEKGKRDSLFNEAQNYYLKALKLKQEIGDKNGIALWLGNIGELYSQTKKYVEAEDYFLNAIKLSKEIGVRDYEREFEESLSDLYSKTNRYQFALEHYKKAMALKDTLFSAESNEKIANTQFKYEQEKKDKIRELEKNAKEQQHEAETKQQKIILWAVIAGLLLVAVFSIFMFNRWRVTQRQKHIIDEQKKLVEEKNKDITDSINYAQRIQRALLASDNLLTPALKGGFSTDYFVLFKPKDIVSGDFYWATEKEGRFYLAVCDSTGHGVPGAFMSLLNISFLNEAINEEEIIQPNEIFNHVRQRLIQNISQDGGKDGMDGILVCFDRNKKEISYSAAHNAPIIVINGTLTELDSDNMPVGMADRLDSFLHQTPNLEPGTVLYLYTDGFADQFGGPKGKKFKYKQLNDLLLANSNKPMNEQRDVLEKTFEDWRGDLEQVDDVLVIGIRI